MNSYINSLRKLAADIDNSRGKQQLQNTQELPARVDLLLAPEEYYYLDFRFPEELPYASHGAGIRFQGASGAYHFFVPEETGIKYRYDRRNTPIDIGNSALSRLLLDRAAGSPYHRTTVADAINMQVQDPRYVAKYRLHLNRQAQRSENKPLYHGFRPYTQAEFDKVMSKTLSSLIRFDRQLKAGAHYKPKLGLIYIPYSGDISSGLTGGRPARSTLPRTANQAMFSSKHNPSVLGEAAMHLINHYTQVPEGSDLGAYAGTLDLLLKLDPYSTNPTLQFQMNAAYTRGKYALMQKLRSNPNDPAFRQFDKQKLKYITTFPLFIGTDIQGLLQFRRLMQFWRLNPLLALMLGNLAVRTVGSYALLLNAWNQYEKKGELVPDVIKLAIRRFLDNRYLGDARRQQYLKQLRNAQRTQYA